MESKTYQGMSILTLVATILIIFNQYLLVAVSAQPMQDGVKMSGDLSTDAIAITISKGAPSIYGAELGISFNEVQAAMDVMKQYDPGYGSNKINLSADKKQRYIDITTKIACEFCCGAKALSFTNGEPACGCAHSQAMRGLTAYLLENHPDQYSNDEMLRELARWKGMYFPKQMINKLITQVQTGEFTPDIAALLMDVDISQYSGTSSPLPSDIDNLPSMVGGC